jgi:hypothetical protein
VSATYSVSFLRKPSDPNHARKLRALEALHEAGVDELPKELQDYFKIKAVSDWEGEKEFLESSYEFVDGFDESPKTRGVTREALRSASGDAYGCSLLIDLDALPEDVKTIQVRLT